MILPIVINEEHVYKLNRLSRNPLVHDLISRLESDYYYDPINRQFVDKGCAMVNP